MPQGYPVLFKYGNQLMFVIIILKCCRIFVFNSRDDLSRGLYGRLYKICMISTAITQTNEWVFLEAAQLGFP